MEQEEWIIEHSRDRGYYLTEMNSEDPQAVWKRDAARAMVYPTREKAEEAVKKLRSAGRIVRREPV